LNQCEGELETWVEWVKRVTNEAREQMTEHRIPDWIEEQRSRVRRWANRFEEMNNRRWAKQVLEW
jgi:hypothetical protein